MSIWREEEEDNTTYWPSVEVQRMCLQLVLGTRVEDRAGVRNVPPAVVTRFPRFLAIEATTADRAWYAALQRRRRGRGRRGRRA